MVFISEREIYIHEQVGKSLFYCHLKFIYSLHIHAHNGKCLTFINCVVRITYSHTYHAYFVIMIKKLNDLSKHISHKIRKIMMENERRRKLQKLHTYEYSTCFCIYIS